MKTIILALVMVASPVSAQTKSCSANTTAAADAVRSRLTAWVEAANAGDAARMRDIWAPRMEGWFPKVNLFSDSAAYAAAGVARDKRAVTTYKLDIAAIDATETFAAVHDVWVETKTFPGESVSVQRTIRSSELWKCQPDGQWRIARYVSAPEAWIR